MGSYTFSSILFFFLLATLASSSPFISDKVFESGVHTGRALLQAKKACPIDFENQNYTILTSQCKGPQYPPKACCEAFKQFACPYTDELNDPENDCDTVMFSYINIYGKYPPGLFANNCKEGKLGLDCQIELNNNTTKPSSSFHLTPPRTMLMISSAAGLLGFIFHLF